MERNLKKIGLTNLIVFLAIGAAATFLAFYSRSLAGQAGAFFLGFGFLVAAVSYFQMRLEEGERLERMEFEELTRDRASASLFNASEAEAFPAQRSREQFERFFVPGFTIVLFILQGVSVYWLWKWFDQTPSTSIQQPAVVMSMFAIFALTLFLLGKYSAGVARIDDKRLLRPGATYLLWCAYVSFAVAGCVAATQLGFPRADYYVARVLTVILGLAAIETLLNLIFEVYRPRIKGAAPRLIYDSRFIALLGQPESLLTTAAQALDYQFGFKVSETWFYRFLERALAWLILLQIGVLLLSSTVVFISPGEQALIERFGRPLDARGVLDPGLHFKFPWPIDQIHRARTREVQTFNIGFISDPQKEKETTVLWTVPHYKEEFNLLVASRSSTGPSTTNDVGDAGVPVDMLTVSLPVQYRVKNLRDWAYKHVDAHETLEKVATREVVRYLLGVDLFDIMSGGRARASEELRSRIQSAADNLELGVEIILVGLQDVHPPVKVASAFENVVGARQELEAKIREAEGYKAKTEALAVAEKARTIHAAEAEAFRIVSAAKSRAALFSHQIGALQAAPSVYQQRAYLEAWERGSTNARKYIIATTNTHDVITLNLEEKARPDLSDLPAPGSVKR